MTHHNFAFKAIKEYTGGISGYSVNCLNWEEIYTQGRTRQNAVEMAIEITEQIIELGLEGEKPLYPMGPSWPLDQPADFVLTFDLDTGKLIEKTLNGFV